MTNPAHAAPPGLRAPAHWTAAVRAQWRISLRLQQPLLALAVILTMVSVVMPGVVSDFGEGLWMFAVFGAFEPWLLEPRLRRSYHHSLPVSSLVQNLARVGGLTLVLAGAVALHGLAMAALGRGGDTSLPADAPAWVLPAVVVAYLVFYLFCTAAELVAPKPGLGTAGCFAALVAGLVVLGRDAWWLTTLMFPVRRPGGTLVWESPGACAAVAVPWLLAAIAAVVYAASRPPRCEGPASAPGSDTPWPARSR